MKIYIDGKFYDREEARISVYDHGLLYGDGVFEGIRAYNGRVFMLEEHVQRLFESAKAILLEPLWSPEEVSKAVVESVRNNGHKDAYIRVVMTRGVGDLGLDMRNCKRPTLIIIADKIQLFPEVYYKKGAELVTSSLRRSGPQSLNPRIKSLNYLTNIMAKAEAVRAGAQEAVLLNSEGYVGECSGDNVFFLKNGSVKTPPIWAGLLGGVTRDVVIRLLRERFQTQVSEELFTTFDLYSADEVFLTGTGAEIVPVVKVDARVIGSGQPGPFTSKLTAAFRELTQKTGTPVFEEAKTR